MLPNVMLASTLATISSPPAGWTTCGGLSDAYNRTACPATQSCTLQKWEPAQGNWGCCPHPEGVSCGPYTCCPKGTKCTNHGSGWSTVSMCSAPSAPMDGLAAATSLLAQYPHVVGSASASPAGTVGAQVCKTGPPVPYSKTLKNVLVVGDSVSIGYTPFVARVMAETALVQHSPWGGDGGAEETKYVTASPGVLRGAQAGGQPPLCFHW
jgi:hypothetical protein